jgi:hypothetical protein
MSTVIKIHQNHRFSLDEARSLLPVVRRVTQRARGNYDLLGKRLEGGPQSPEQCSKIESELNRTVVEWSEVIKRLGCEVRGLWIVDFDCGDGYFCWKCPEEELLYFRGYNTGFSTRVLIESISSHRVQNPS